MPPGTLPRSDKQGRHSAQRSAGDPRELLRAGTLPLLETSAHHDRQRPLPAHQGTDDSHGPFGVGDRMPPGAPPRGSGQGGQAETQSLDDRGEPSGAGERSPSSVHGDWHGPQYDQHRTDGIPEPVGSGALLPPGLGDGSLYPRGRGWADPGPRVPGSAASAAAVGGAGEPSASAASVGEAGEPSASEVPSSPADFPVISRRSRAARQPWLLPDAPGPSGIAADQASLGGLEVLAASVVGSGHRGRGLPRQDAYRIGRDDAGRHLVLAVADGMSDSAHSDVGATVAVTALVAGLREEVRRFAGLPAGRLAREHPDNVFLSAAGQVNGVARQRGWSPDEVRSVAVAAVIAAEPDADGGRAAVLGAVGDASAWLLGDGRWHQVLGRPKAGMDANRVAAFLPYTTRAAVEAEVRLLPGDVLVLATDGVGEALEAFPGWFARRWQQPPPVGAFMLDVGFEQEQFQDDRTAVAVWCGPLPGSEGAG
ncbi:protein phosphatase 2C domain-containing protein [Yinghuangia seranimata]|uniref:protein phosphatase 2C domain-containing protein n=1 Tax=Yinghuangia seranimata TaxID=408067 RepID=UPI00248CDB2F|nr:protein phosphatase 2C domain-containing protein [Yinghuangia seranimata]MDI2129827.1 protein phosphatase 2C domain-containing protein [Yinghuangia seranimata]